MKPKLTVHMIGQAHLDPVWLWRWTEGRAEALATSKSAVDRLHEYPDFHFNRGEAQIYEWIKQENPELFEEIRQFVRQGRWHLVNGMVVQPDMNLPQGESFVRHFLLGKKFMCDEFGVEPHVAYCVDSFGHAVTLPQIFKQCGFDAYVFMRPGPHEKALPEQIFWWQGPDGSRVMAFRITDPYCTRKGDQAEFIDRAVKAAPGWAEDTMCFFGLGNHGGGPTKQQIESVQEIAGSRDDIAIRFSSPEAYFQAIQAKANQMQVVADELQIHAVGCYTANSQLKRLHRQAECSLLVAERMAVMAKTLVGLDTPGETLNGLWHDLTFNQFHDIICGCAIKEAEDEAVMVFGRILTRAREIANDAGRAIAARINTSGPGGTVIFFNPFPYPVTQYAEYEPWTEWQNWKTQGWGLVDEQNCPVPHQLIETQEALTSPEGGLNRLVFQAQLPAMGYRLYRFAPGLPVLPPSPGVVVTETRLENEHLTIRLDPQTGAIASCVDRETGIEIVGARGWNVAEVLEDTSDTWSHDFRLFDKVIGCFGSPKITVFDQGPLQASLLVERQYEQSTWLQQIVLRQGEKEILVRNWLFWEGKWRLIKLACDVAVSGSKAAHDIPFGWMYRPTDGAEVPTQMWMDVSGAAADSANQVAGLTIINDGKYGCDVSESTARLTILRCPPYANHKPHPMGTKHRYDWLDQGCQEFNIVLKPHVGAWEDAGAVRRAVEFNLPLVPITMHGHSGDLPALQSLAALTSDEISLTALKFADDGYGLIVRLADRHGRGGQGQLQWMGQAFPVSVKPFEVITLRLIHTSGRWQVIACDMLERSLPEADF